VRGDDEVAAPVGGGEDPDHAGRRRAAVALRVAVGAHVAGGRDLPVPEAVRRHRQGGGVPGGRGTEVRGVAESEDLARREQQLVALAVRRSGDADDVLAEGLSVAARVTECDDRARRRGDPVPEAVERRGDPRRRAAVELANGRTERRGEAEAVEPPPER